MHGLRDLFNDPRRARSLHWGGGVLCIALLAALIWAAWVQGGTRLDTPMGLVLVGSAVAALGALPALFISHISGRWEAIMLGFDGGVMVAAACFSLILPGIEAGSGRYQGGLPHHLRGLCEPVAGDGVRAGHQ